MLKERVIEAYNVSKKYHKGQVRKFSNHSYFVHPKCVARIVSDLTSDEDLIIVALLHDTLEDTEITELEIQDKFGVKVLSLVLELTSNIPEGMNKADYLIKKMNNLSRDALIVKLADRYHNVRYLLKDCKTKDHLKFAKRYYNETEKIVDGISTRCNSDDRRDDPIKVLMNGILFSLDYLNTKYGW